MATDSANAATDIPNKAYVTYIGAGNEDELKGVVGLAKGLRRAESKYPLVVAIASNLDEKQRESLESLGCRLEKIVPIRIPVGKEADRYASSKIRLWELKNYNRMIYLNPDVQVYGNIDSLMNVPEGICFAVTGCFCKQTGTEIGIGTGTQTQTGNGTGTGTSTGVGTGTGTRIGTGTGTGVGTGTGTLTGSGIGSNTGTGCEQPNTYSPSRCQKCPNTVTEPDEGGLPSPLYFNLGLVVFKPDPNTYNYLLEALGNRTTSTLPLNRLDDSKLRSMYSVMSLKDYLILDTPLPRHLNNDEQEKAKVVHYRAVESKPWKEENKEKAGIQMLVKKWLDIYTASGCPEEIMIA